MNMLDPRKSKTYNDSKAVSLIGAGTQVNGEIISKGTIHVEGTVTGKVQCEDTIVVKESGHVKADLHGGQVIISGEVQGNVYALDRLEITGTGKVVGDITAPRISIAEGVLFEGKCTMKVPSPQPPAKA
jgi:cytoskeletal protein CcmA (bactofilin family)